jgi:hypothetical protein
MKMWQRSAIEGASAPSTRVPSNNAPERCPNESREEIFVKLKQPTFQR